MSGTFSRKQVLLGSAQSSKIPSLVSQATGKQAKITYILNDVSLVAKKSLYLI